MGNKGYTNQAKSGQRAVPAKRQRIKDQRAVERQRSAGAQLPGRGTPGRGGPAATVHRADPPLTVRVEAYAGSRAEETPRCFTVGGHTVEVLAVTERWRAPDHEYFKIVGNDGQTYGLRYDVAEDRWELIEQPPSASRREHPGPRA